MKAKLITLKNELYKTETTILMIMIGPPLPMLMMSEGVLSVQQKVESGVLIPFELVTTPCIKRTTIYHTK